MPRAGSRSPHPTPLEPRKKYELHIPIDASGWRFTSGNRLRISIANSDWPNIWPTPDLATSEINHGASYPSRIILPTVPSRRTLANLPLLRRRPTWTLRPRWHDRHDGLSFEMPSPGRSRWKLSFGAERRVDAQTVLSTDVSFRCQVNPRDPAHAQAQGSSIHRIEQDGHVTEARSRVQVNGTATHFHTVVGAEVRINHGVSTRSWRSPCDGNCCNSCTEPCVPISRAGWLRYGRRGHTSASSP